MPPLFVTDPDGTLLRTDRGLSPYSAVVLNAAIGDGVGVTYATARSHYTARPLVAAVRFRLPATVYNGAFAIDPATRAPLHCNILDAEVAEEAIAEGLSHGPPPFVFGLEAGREVAMRVRPVKEGQACWLRQREAARDPRLMPVARLCPPERAITVQFVAPPAALTDLSAAMARRLEREVAIHTAPDTYQPDSRQFEIHHARANKRDMTCRVAERCGIRPSDRGGEAASGGPLGGPSASGGPSPHRIRRQSQRPADVRGRGHRGGRRQRAARSAGGRARGDHRK